MEPLEDLSESQIEILISKKKLVKSLLFSLILTATSGFLIFISINALANGNGSVAKLFLAYTIGIIAVLAFGMAGLHTVSRFFNSKPGLIISETEIIDNSSGISLGRVPWSDIVDVTVTSTFGQKFISLYLRNPNEYIAKHKGLKKCFLIMNQKTFGTPMFISELDLNITFDELLQILADYRYRNYRKHLLDST